MLVCQRVLVGPTKTETQKKSQLGWLFLSSTKTENTLQRMQFLFVSP